MEVVLLCCLALVESLSNVASQLKKDCLEILLLNQISEHQGTLGLGALIQCQVAPTWKIRDSDGIHLTLSSDEIGLMQPQIIDCISTILLDLAARHTHSSLV